ncbi:hypothetical protein [Teredinibacter turnerae]|uniref:hypothetical protein n=1 Tax=Teredinibacter turnerae TaxID=2426 RepID=UPI00035F73A9|nr:hypothetical protein [Teredinibacter turnerae]
MDEISLNLHTANSRYDDILLIHKSFIEHINESCSNGGEFISLHASEGVISIECFGYEYKATPKYVYKSTRNKSFYVEYVFKCEVGEEFVEVWRCYLNDEGVVVNSIEENERVFEFNNMYVKSKLAKLVANAALASKLFKPTE